MITRLTSLNLSQKIPLASLLMVFVSVAITVVISFYSSKSEIESQASAKLEAVLASRTSELGSYLTSIREGLILTADNPNTAQAVMTFRQAWQDMGDGAAGQIYAAYKTDQLDKLYDTQDGTVYTAAHVAYHPWFHKLQQERGYYDVFLFDLEGNLVYSVFKEADFATNMHTGEWRETDLANVYRDAMKLNTAGTVSFYDFRPYKPSADAPASFIATPVFDAGGNKAGVLAFQMPVERINNLMQKSEGMGASGESYIVGSDRLMRSDSRFLEEGDKSSILNTRIDGETTTLALQGKSGVDIIDDYRGVSVFSAYAPLSFEGTRWAVLVEIDYDEVAEPVDAMLWFLILVGAVLTLLLAALGYFGARTITRPIGETVDTMNVLSKENRTDIDVPFQDRHDELGSIASAVEGFRLGMIEREQMRSEAEEAAKAEAEREALAREEEAAREAARREREQMRAEEQERKARALETLVSDFNLAVTEAMEVVATATTELEATAGSMLSVAEQTGSQSAGAASAAEEASSNVQMVASAAEEMAASVAEIRNQLENSNTATQQVSEKSRVTSDLMGELSESSRSISDIVALISDIAEQTNLLALNATIEAARAGEAGRGFAVVASEVKTLAGQTASATSQISEQVTDIQKKVEDALTATGDISESVVSNAELTSAAAAAVEQQQATTQEITRNIVEASKGTQEVSSNIASVSQGAGETASASSQVSATASDMAKQMNALKSTISRFVDGVRNLSEEAA